ncbi:MAG TPA: cytochrome c-type biogenesis protein [Herminiimonas sp.]|nr:cytochrome c-type biogenesis protein [Herminiimonas sp.]
MPKSIVQWLLWFACGAVLLLALEVHAQQEIPLEKDSVLEKHVTHLSEQLRCLVCQNQTIADSQAPLAIELKEEVREKLARGASDKDVIDFMVQRYGDFVLYRPPVKATTLVLWFGPFLLLLFGFIFLIFKLRQPRTTIQKLTPADEKRAAALLADESELKIKP